MTSGGIATSRKLSHGKPQARRLRCPTQMYLSQMFDSDVARGGELLRLRLRGGRLLVGPHPRRRRLRLRLVLGGFLGQPLLVRIRGTVTLGVGSGGRLSPNPNPQP